MKFKYVLLSGLFLSTGFVACTNEELVEIAAPVNTEEAIALGENYTINVNKVGDQTRSAFNENLSPYWEADDQLGAAWVHLVTGYDANYNVINCNTIGGSYGGFYSNHPFDLIEGVGTNNASFKTVTNAFAGAYVLYYPYNPNVAMQGNEIPVSIKTYETDCKDGETLKNVSENMFSYCPAKFVPGGNQTGQFNLQQIPTLFALRFTPDEKLNMDLAGGITIKNIVIEAKKSRNTVLMSAGKIVTNKAPEADNYNGVNGKDLSEIVQYVGTTYADNFFITALNSDNDNYKMLVKNEPTKKQFIFSALPFSDKADEVIVKVVTDKGVYKKVYEASDAEDVKYINEFNNATQEGGQVRINVILDVTELDDVIYTADEFMKRWNAAATSSTKATLKIGTPLTLTDGLTCDNGYAEIEVKGAALTIPSLNIAKNRTITFSNELVVDGNVFTSGAAEFVANDLTAKEVEIQGEANLKVRKADLLTVASSGIVNLSSAAAGSSIKSIVLEEGTTAVGKLTLNSTDLAITTITGTADTELTLAADMTNPANATLTLGKVNAGAYTLTNNGIVYLNGTYTTTGEIINNAGATLNVNYANSFNLTNSASDGAKAAGVVNIAAGATLTVTTNKEVKNMGIINVTGTLTESAADKLTQTTSDDARIIAKTDNAVIKRFASSSALAKGYIIILKDANYPTAIITNEPTAFEMNKASDASSVPTKANSVFVKYNAKASELSKLIAKNLVLYNNLSLDADMTTTGKFMIAGDVTVSATAAQTLSLSNTPASNSVLKGAKMTIGSYVTLDGASSNATLDVYGSFVNNGGTIGSNITVQYK